MKKNLFSIGKKQVRVPIVQGGMGVGISLARDLVMLQESGYEVKKGCCIDMFPNTGHVESVVLMQYCGK